MKNIIKLVAALTLVVSLASCSEEFIERPRPLVMNEDIIYSDANYIESALLGCYSAFKSSNPTFMAGLAYVVFDSRGDDIVNVSNPVTMQRTYEMEVLPTELENGRIWNYAYYTINTCNIFIDNLTNYECEKVLGADKCKQFAAEAKFIRAYCYYVLVNLYSQPYCLNPDAPAVPLRLKGLTAAGNNDCPLSTIGQVYAQMLEDCIPSDLVDAPETYDGVTRASAAAAHMMRMRVYMAMQDWDNAIAEGNAIKGYSLAEDVSTLYGVDTYKNKEMIFALPMSTQDNPNTQMSAAEYFSAKATVCWLDTESGIMSQPGYFLAKDQRIAKLVSEPDGNGYQYSMKFVDYGQKLDWLPLMRYAETLLNLAECYTHKTDGTAQAKANLKAVRNRSIAPADDVFSIDNLSGGNLTTAVINERRLEFICEGMRGIDIIRRGENFSKKNSVIDLNITPGDANYTWPIYKVEKDYNKAI
ncbi:MAG: RagB/SusD family nutrient uptake outer membrane protein [Bacteroidales bacterium]|nr:RagB/SusD family nutrient uptake outer membrane protein [Bacteroidales bacterium]